MSKEKKEENKDIVEDETTTKRIISNLSFIENDLNSIEKLNIETPEIKQLVSEIKNKVEELFDKLLKRK